MSNGTEDKTIEKFSKMKSKILSVAVGLGGSLAVAAPCFAAEPTTVTPFVVTSEMAAPIFTGITTSVTNLLPLGLGVMSVMIGIGLIPVIVHKFL